MKYFLIAGESSGDLHGSNLMKELKLLDNNTIFHFYGGDLMLNQGGTLLSHFKERAYMGITDVMLNINKIFKALKLCKQQILDFKPDALILIDYPGFNLRIAQWAHQNNIKVHYYISPKVWAWNTKRALKIKKYVDYLYCILPFEINFFKQFNMDPDYVGNPLKDAISSYTFASDFKEKIGVQKPYIALLPGSRKSELKHILPHMLSVINFFPEYEFVLAAANHFQDEIYQSDIKDLNIKVVKNATYDIVKNAHAALVCSGTATLETALLECPQVVCYKFSKLSYAIGKLVIKIKYISLVNLILDRPLVKELIQNELNKDNIIKELNYILEGINREKILLGYMELLEKVGEKGASQKTSKLIVDRTMK